MKEKLVFDDGIKRLDVNGNGVLSFHPADFNVYQRLCTVMKELPELEKKYHVEVESADTEAASSDAVELAGKCLDKAKEIDGEIKKKLMWVFGPENDFDKLLNGVNLMSPAGNGERVITNFLNAINPYLEDGIKKHMKDAAIEAVTSAEKNRAKRKHLG